MAAISHKEHANLDLGGLTPTTLVEHLPHAYAEHGPLVDHKIPQDDVVQQGTDLAWSRIRHYLREPFAEFLGTFIIIM